MVGRWLPTRPPRRLLDPSHRLARLRLGRSNFVMRPRLALVANLNPPVLPLTHPYLGLPRRIVTAPLQLKIAILITHYPVVGNASLLLQAKYLLQLAGRRRLAMIILLLVCGPRKTGIVIRSGPPP